MNTREIVEIFFERKKINKDNFEKWNYLLKEELYQCEIDFDKKLLDFDIEEFLLMISTFKNKNKPLIEQNAVYAVRSCFIQFFDWCVENNYVNENIIKSNKKELSNKSMIEYLSNINGDNLKLFTSQQIEDACEKLSLVDGGIYYEGIIRTFYEGIEDTTDFIKIKYDDVNWEKCYIDLDLIKIKISNRLKDIYFTVHKSSEILLDMGTRSRMFILESFDNSLYKFPVYGKIENCEYDARIYALAKGINQSRFAAIEKITGYKFTSKNLYLSWIYNHLLEYCNRDISKLSNLILGEDSKSKCKILDPVLKTIGCKYCGYEVRAIFKPYFIKLK